MRLNYQLSSQLSSQLSPQWFSSFFKMETWQTAAGINATLGAMTILFWPRSNQAKLWSYVALACALCTALVPTTHIAAKILVFCVCIPIIEECLFRRDISSWLRKRYGQTPGFALSVLVFCLCHNHFSGFSLTNIVEFIMFFGAGVFVLALILEGLWQKWQSMILQVSVHGVANAAALMTVMLPPEYKNLLTPLIVEL